MEEGWLSDIIEWLRGTKATLKPFNSDGWHFQYTDGKLHMQCLCGMVVKPTDAARHKSNCTGKQVKLRLSIGSLARVRASISTMRRVHDKRDKKVA